MTKRLTEEEIQQLSDIYGFSAERIRDAANDTKLIDQILKEHPEADLDEAVLSVVVRKGFVRM